VPSPPSALKLRAALASVASALVLLAPARAAAIDEISPQLKYNYGEDETARLAAMGGALRALGSGTTGMVLNPADLVETRVYHLEALAQIVPEAARQVYGGIVMDSITGRLAGGIAVTGGFIDPDGIDRSQLGVRLALAYPITDKLFVGIGGRYAKVTQSGENAPFGGKGVDKPAGGLVDSDGGRFAFVNTFTFDAGLTARVSDNIYVGVLGQNLSYPNNAILPTTFGGGVGFGNSDLSIEADGVADFNSWAKTSGRFMVGAEYLAGDHFPLRLGYRYDQGAKLNWLSAGLGYIATEFSVEASVRRSLSDPGLTYIVIGLAYFLESSGLTRSPTSDLE
jgi:hypothetical protein